MANAPATWKRLALSDRLMRSSHTLSILHGKVWIFGGELHPRQPVDNALDTVHLPSAHQNGTPTPSVPAVQTIPAPASAPSPRVGAAAAVLAGNLYLFSGRGGPSMTPIDEHGGVWRFDAAAHDAWTLVAPRDAAAPRPPARSYHAAASDGVSALYVHGGCAAGGRLADFWCFDVGRRGWRRLADAPGAARGGAGLACCARRGRVYRMNGFDGQREVGGSLDVYDVRADAWSSIGFVADGREGPEPRSVGALLAVRVKQRDVLVTVAGERDPSALGHEGAGKMLGDVWLFDLDVEKWTKVEAQGDSPAPRGWFAADVWRVDGEDDKIVLHGGLGEDNERLGDVWLLCFG